MTTQCRKIFWGSGTQCANEAQYCSECLLIPEYVGAQGFSEDFPEVTVTMEDFLKKLGISQRQAAYSCPEKGNWAFIYSNHIFTKEMAEVIMESLSNKISEVLDMKVAVASMGQTELMAESIGIVGDYDKVEGLDINSMREVVFRSRLRGLL